MTRTHELPADAFRRDRAHERTPMLHDIEPAPVTDHLTIEQRLSRLEADRDAIYRQFDELFRVLAELRAGPDSATIVADVLNRLAAAMREGIEKGASHDR